MFCFLTLVIRITGGRYACRCKPVPLNLEPPHYLPEWDKVEPHILENTALVYLTYPNNPTGSTATKAVFDAAINQFKDTKTKIVHDFAYSAFGFDAKTQVY